MEYGVGKNIKPTFVLPICFLKGPCHLRLSFSMLKSYVHWSLGHASFPLKQNKEEEIKDFPKILRIVCV